MDVTAYNLYQTNNQNTYSSLDNTVNITIQSKTDYFVVFNWDHGNQDNCLKKLINNEFVPFCPTKKRFKIIIENDDGFIIHYENYEGLYMNGIKNINTIIFHNNNNNNIHASVLTNAQQIEYAEMDGYEPHDF
tara:strand:- start:1153 stop:1551 length:399 start_codon:yes stop_codon:yes gene_type:complete